MSLLVLRRSPQSRIGRIFRNKLKMSKITAELETNTLLISRLASSKAAPALVRRWLKRILEGLPKI